MAMTTKGRVWTVIALWLGACSGNSDTPSDASPDCVFDCPPCTEPPCVDTVGIWPAEINRDLDILFVIDNTWSMAEEQAALLASFDRFVYALENVQMGLPNLHIGVISTDVGAGPYGITGCDGFGDFGTLQSAPRIPGCNPPDGWYISDVGVGSGRERNYSGTLAEVFSCIAKLGTGGCRFPQPLEAARRALDGTNPVNEGFSRDDASLLVFFLSDKDDCSAEDTAVFDVPDITEAQAPLLCFQHGVVCDPDEPLTPGAKSNCVSRDDSAYLYGVYEYEGFFRQLKSDPNMVMFAGIIGDATPVSVSERDGGLELDPSCSSAAGTAVPAVRMKDFLDRFPQRNTINTVCNEDLSDAFIMAAQIAAKVTGHPCVDRQIADPSQCWLYEWRKVGVDVEEILEIEQCVTTSPPDPLPCFLLATDEAACTTSPDNRFLQLFHGNENIPPNSLLVLRCLVNDVPTRALPSSRSAPTATSHRGD